MVSPVPIQAALAVPQIAGEASRVDAAKALMLAGRFADARAALLSLQKTKPKDSEIEFLLGMLAVEQKDYPTAIRTFRGILARQPGAARVRLELGRAFFLNRDYDNAERQFRLARAANLPPAVMANIDRYLYAIRQARVFTYNLSVALAPDTDLNAGPSIQTVDIFGLPFKLSDQARRQSGVGVAVDAGGEWSPWIASGLRVRLGGQVHTTDYGAAMFDDTTLSGYVGPRFVSGRWDVSPLATYYRRWYGGRFYNQGAGGSVQAIYYATPRIAFQGVLSGQEVDFTAPTEQGGPAVSGSIGAIYTLTPTSFVSGGVAIARQWAGFRGYANTALQAQVGYNRDLPYGFTVSFEPSFVRIAYDGPLAAFGQARVDNQWSLETTVLNRRFDIMGFTPRLRYVYTHDDSNIALYAYDRSRVEMGLTRLF